MGETVVVLRGRVRRRSERALGTTPAELRTLQYLPTHYSFREIGEQLVVSVNTVRSQAQAVYRKLGASSRREAVERAQNRGLIETLSEPPTAVKG